MDKELIQLDDYYDVIIEGTGLVQSIISVACSAIGKKVLHIDQDSSYGGHFKTFTLNSFRNWLKNLNYKNPNQTNIFNNIKPNTDECNEKYDYCSQNSIFNQNESNKLYSMYDEKLKAIENEFYLDISPHLILAAEKIINVIRLFVQNYADFGGKDGCYVIKNDFVNVKIPLTKHEIFESGLELNEKRELNQFLNYFKICENSSTDIEKAFQLPSKVLSKIDGPFKKFIDSFNLSKLNRDFIVFGLSQLDSFECKEINKKEIFKKTIKKELKLKSASEPCGKVFPDLLLFLQSFGIYKKGLFIYPFYGLLDLIEGFCRASSVKGATYALNINIKSILFSKQQKSVKRNKIEGICTEFGQNIKCDYLICPSSRLPLKLKETGRELTRAVIIVTEPVLEKNCIFAVIPPGNDVIQNKYSIKIIQISSDFCVCPLGYYIIYISTPFHSNSTEEINNCSKALFTLSNSEKNNKLNKKMCSKLLFKEIYQQKEILMKRDSEFIDLNFLRNLHFVDDSDNSLTLENCFLQAKTLFNEMFPEEEFLKESKLENEISEEIRENEIELNDVELESDNDLNFFKNE